MKQNRNNLGKITSTVKNSSVEISVSENLSPVHYLKRTEYVKVLSILKELPDLDIKNTMKDSPESLATWKNLGKSKCMKRKFKYDTTKYPKHANFVPYDTWKRKMIKNSMNWKDKVNSSTCIHSKSLNFNLSYKEVYGRILGSKSETIDRSELRWLNDAVIDSFIEVMVYRASKNPIAYI